MVDGDLKFSFDRVKKVEKVNLKLKVSNEAIITVTNTIIFDYYYVSNNKLFTLITILPITLILKEVLDSDVFG